MSDDAKVVTTAFMPKTLFRGLEKDARKFVEDNFPRIHVEPGTDKDEPLAPNVHLVLPNGNKEFLHGDAGWQQHEDNKPESPAPTASPIGDQLSLEKDNGDVPS